MLKFAKVLTGITMVLLLFLLVVLYGVNLQVKLTGFEVADDPQLLSTLIETARRDDMGSDLFKRPGSSDPSQFQWIRIKVDVRNAGVLPAEWLQLRVAPQAYDLALFPGDPIDLAPFGGLRAMEAQLLTERDADTRYRDIRLQYYIFGRRMEVAVH